jgi:hypothetical protein
MIIDLSRTTAAAGASMLEARLTLKNPCSRFRLRLPPGDAGRAEARFAEQSWAAKHYWQEASGDTVYEFDEPLPAGPVSICIPFRSAAAQPLDGQ